MTRVPAMRTLENSLRRVGFVHVAGVAEVGRGCLAGPVMAAAVVLHPDRHIPGVCDSKLVPAPEREKLYDKILAAAVAAVYAFRGTGKTPDNRLVVSGNIELTEVSIAFKTAGRLVERLFREKKDAIAVVAALRADGALAEPLRQAALRAVMRRPTQ